MSLTRRAYLPGILALLAVGTVIATCGGNADDGLTPITGGAGGSSGTGGTGGGAGAAAEPDAPPTACPVFPAVRLTTAPGESLQPAIEWTGSGWIVAWGDARAGGMDIYGVMLAPDASIPRRTMLFRYVPLPPATRIPTIWLVKSVEARESEWIKFPSTTFAVVGKLR